MEQHVLRAILSSLLRQPDMRPALRHTGSGVVLLPYGASDMTGALGLDVALERQPQLLTGPVRALLAEGPPELILSGINRGANLGVETVFSGTVGAAMTLPSGPAMT